MDFEVSYIDICKGKGVVPIEEITQVLQSQSENLTICASTKLTDSDIFCLSRVLEENFEFLEELCISGQNMSQSSTSVLAQGLKNSHGIRKLTITSVNFENLSLFYKIPEALTLNEGLKYIDLSGNSLSDLVGSSLLELLGVLPNLETLNISYNQLESIEWGHILSVNTSLKCLFIDYNNLTYQSIKNLLESLQVNRSVRVMSLMGNQKNEVFCSNICKVLSGVLKSSVVQSLSVDLNEHCSHFDLLGQVLLDHNTDLTEIPPLEEVSDPTTAIKLIWSSLKANRWIYQKLQDPAADLEIDSDFQEILESKLSYLKDQESPQMKIEEIREVPPIETPQFSNYRSGREFKLDTQLEGSDKAEEDLIARAYNSPREEEKSLISTSIFNDSPRNFTYSESSKSGTPNLESPRILFEREAAKYLQRYIKTYEDRFFAALDTARAELLKEIQSVSRNCVDFQSQSQESEKFISQAAGEWKDAQQKILAQVKSLERHSEIIENRVSGLEKGEKFRAQELSESRGEAGNLKESLKDLNVKIEKYELNSKLQINSLKKSMCKKQELTAFQEQLLGVSSEAQSLTMNFSMIDLGVEKIKQALAGLQRNEKLLLKKKEDFDSFVIEARQRLSYCEEKLEVSPNVSLISHNLLKEIDSKFAKLEIKVWENLEKDSSRDSRTNSKTFEKKFQLFDEKISKVYENLKELSRSLSKIDAFRLPERLERLEKDKNSPKKTQAKLKQSEEVSELSRSQSTMKTCKRSSPVVRCNENLSNRVESGQSLNLEFIELDSKKEYLPGEAESIVLSAIIDKANKNRTPLMRKSFSALSLHPPAQTTTAKTSSVFKNFEDILPSAELQESLKQRGIRF